MKPAEFENSKERASMSDLTDKRFSAAHKNPKFKNSHSKKNSHKIVLDPRFNSVLTDDRFKVGPGNNKVDKYGRKSGKKTKGSDQVEDELSEFYTIADDEEKEKNEKNVVKDDRFKMSAALSENDSSSGSGSGSESESPETTEKQTPEERIRYLNDLARGNIDIDSSDSGSDSDSVSDSAGGDSDSSTSDFDDEILEDVEAGVLTGIEEEIPTSENLVTNAMAFMNFDWEHVRAVDLFVLIQSFSGVDSIDKVVIYPSDFGMDRLRKDLVMGPLSIMDSEKLGGGVVDEEEEEEEEEEEKEKEADSDVNSDSDSDSDSESESDSESDSPPTQPYDHDKKKDFNAEVNERLAMNLAKLLQT